MIAEKVVEAIYGAKCQPRSALVLILSPKVNAKLAEEFGCVDCSHGIAFGHKYIVMPDWMWADYVEDLENFGYFKQGGQILFVR